MLNRADFARKTLYGAGIISHILKEQYPGDEVVMHVKGRDCGVCRNPFDDGKPSLKVWIEKLHPEQKLSDELCYYQDLSGHIPDGNAFDFAERFYGKKDQDLLEHLNKVMYLHIGEQFRQYDKPQPEPEAPVEVQQPMFTFFKRPVTNTIPCKDITLKEAYDYITSPAAKAQTEKLRTIADKKEARKFKKYNFDYVSFSGTFSYRDDDHITKPSNLLCVDFDHLPNVEEMFQKLLHDRYFTTELLFRSPSGDGLKWVIPIEYRGHTHEQIFDAVYNYVSATYGTAMDRSCSDMSRPCYLPFDAGAYLNPKYM